jgi:hypothetical protein
VVQTPVESELLLVLVAVVAQLLVAMEERALEAKLK